jgi:hypothetical protein
MEFRREYLVRLPLPLAQLYSRAFNAKDPRSRHDNAFYLFEATIKLAAVPAVACYAQDVRSGGTRFPELDRLLLQLALPSLGQWVAIVRELSRHFGQRPDALDHPLGQLSKQLSEKRREHTGHTAAACAALAAGRRRSAVPSHAFFGKFVGTAPSRSGLQPIGTPRVS